MKLTRNQTNGTTANQFPKMNNYLLVKIALAGIISSLFLTNLKSAFWTLILFIPIFLLTREQEKHKTKEE